ncbi:MAG: aminotransferase class V-fold PLP-dependent enzyme [Acidobacteria bacterium]|nr:aminotransferase class V-fold PLP-dependent enzyme [Acidobacteriota bacterium]MBI3657648.1 aminotransferase class V-fold PLP-dependent enzyme [Acidobacteriota bacterium]
MASVLRFGAAAFATLREDSIDRVLAAGRRVTSASTEAAAADEDFWREIQQAFTVDRSLINLNNGGVSPSPRVVQGALRRYQEYSNQAPVYTMWQVLEPQIEGVRRRLAAAFGCDAEEMAITRNASEALEICQLGLNLQRGDEVLTTNQDYPRMLTTWRQRAERDGIVLKTISFPTPPPNLDYLAELFEKNISPRTRAIMVCHITYLTGQIFPIKRICQMARARGVEVIVDGAHAFAHFPFQLSELDCDYYGTSLHKWLLAPHGTGFLYVRKQKIADLWPLMAAPAAMRSNIRKFEEIGTHPAANHNAIAEALTFHEGIGAERKAARLRYLKNRWVERLSRLPGVRLLTSPHPAQSCGLGLLSIDGKDPGPLAAHLWEKYRILVTAITHDEFRGLRITPNVYTTLEEIDAFCDAVEKAVRA